LEGSVTQLRTSSPYGLQTRWATARRPGSEDGGRSSAGCTSSRVKTREGASHPDRDAQFEHINTVAKAAIAAGVPVISVDTKKKELVGDFKNAGREWRPRGEPELVRVHDFKDKQLGKAIPYGVYDIASNQGWVSIGIDHDIEAIAERVADKLRRPVGVGLLKVDELAARLGVAPDWVYRHARQLGVIKLGTAQNAPLRFDLERAQAALAALGESPQEEPRPDEPARRRGRPRKGARPAV
jgi:Rhodopirellula transposase DDE domain